MAKTTRQRKSVRRSGRRANKAGALDESTLREIALQFPDVADGTTARGVAFLAAGQPTHWVAPDLDRVFEATRGPKLTARAKRWRKALDQRLAAL